jgi:hypothetical protein
MTRAELAAGVGQMVQCLPSKHEALSSKPRWPKKSATEQRTVQDIVTTDKYSRHFFF